ncbi:hypothetical protein [Streptomyces thermolilacinus]|uniref:hypothetical protein n=1 Tax=Streptomyces thermolilacinus TaxID=285540 RepID=UPI003F4CFD1A
MTASPGSTHPTHRAGLTAQDPGVPAPGRGVPGPRAPHGEPGGDPYGTAPHGGRGGAPHSGGPSLARGGGSGRAPGVPRGPVLRGAAATPPGRLRVLGAVLALLVVLFGAVTSLEVTDRSDAADDVVGRSQPLSADAAHIYRSLADADTAAASGFLAGAQEPADVRARYEKDIATAARLLVKAAAHTDGSSASAAEITTLNEQLPQYTGLVERARAANRQGLPLGGAYLRYANQRMTAQLLPAAERLYEAETARLAEDEADARAWPVLSLSAGVLVLGALAWAQWRDQRRTNRLLNPGLLAATAATAVVLLWLAGAHTMARTGLGDARAQGQDSLKVLNEARIGSLKARANENLTLVARGAVLTDDGKNDKYATEYAAAMTGLDRALAEARRLADDPAGEEPVRDAIGWAGEWRERHAAVRRTDEAGDYEGAVKHVIGGEASTGAAFDRVDAALRKALDHEQGEFTRTAGRARHALTGLPAGAAALAVLGAVGVVTGVNRRLAEYR